MSEETARRAIQFAADQSAGAFQLGFFGGEPLQQWSLLQSATRMAREALGARPLTLTVTTNGIGLSRERVAWLHNEGFFVAVSMDGNRTMHDACRKMRGGHSSFDAVRRGLENALSHPDDLEVIMVIDPANVEHAAEGVEYLTSLGVRRISLNPNFFAHLTNSFTPTFSPTL